MKAIILVGRHVVGYHPNPNFDELTALGTTYELVEEVPEIIYDTPEGFEVIKNDDGEYALIERPSDTIPEPKTPEQERIEQLEAQNLTLMEAVADLYEMLLGS